MRRNEFNIQRSTSNIELRTPAHFNVGPFDRLRAGCWAFNVRRSICLLISVACLLAPILLSGLSPAVHAGNIYPVRVSDGSTTGDVDTLRFSGATLTIANLSGGGRMGTLTIATGGAGGGTNFQAGLGLQFLGSSPDLTIRIDPSIVLTAGAPVSAIAGAVSASSTNNLADKSLVNSTSNTIMQAVNTVNSNATSLTLIPSNGVLFIDLGGGSNALAIDPSVVVTAGAPFSVFSGEITMTQLPTNGINNTSWSGAVVSNGLLVTAGSVVPVTNVASTASALVAGSVSAGMLTVTPNPQTLTNSGTQALFWNGTATISNNATVTGTFTVNGTLNASNIVGAVTSAVAAVNGLVSNVTLTATGNATISTASSGNGGMITINDPKIFAATNPPSAGAGAPLIFDTKYGAMRVSNNFGFTFIDAPQLNGMSNIVDSMSSWFTSASTDAWTQVNMTNSWLIINTNNHLLLNSGGAAVASGQYLVNQINSSNTPWSYSILLDGIEDGGTTTFNAGIGIVSMEGTNMNCHNFVIVRGGAAQPQLRGFLSSSPNASFQVADTGGADPGSSVGMIYGAVTTFHTDLPSPMWLRVGYDGSTNLTYQYAFVRVGQPAIFHTISIKTNQTTLLSNVGIVFADLNGAKPAYLIKAAVFEQPWALNQP